MPELTSHPFAYIALALGLYAIFQVLREIRRCKIIHDATVASKQAQIDNAKLERAWAAEHQAKVDKLNKRLKEKSYWMKHYHHRAWGQRTAKVHKRTKMRDECQNLD